MQFDFTGKRVLVTGGSRGIGRAAVTAFQDAGATVAINGRTAESVSAAIEAFDDTSRLVPAPGDIGTAAGCKETVSIALEHLGRLDVLVNCAGVAHELPVEASDEDIWDQTLDINLKGTFFCSRAALIPLRATNGNIVNLASDAGLMGAPGLTVYCASKGGVVNLTRALALELAPDIRVNCVCPGYVDTDMVRRDMIDKSSDPAAAEQELISYAPLKRIATPPEIASAILYLASPQARFVTGSALQIDGGTTAGQ